MVCQTLAKALYFECKFRLRNFTYKSCNGFNILYVLPPACRRPSKDIIRSWFAIDVCPLCFFATLLPAVTTWPKYSHLYEFQSILFGLCSFHDLFIGYVIDVRDCEHSSIDQVHMYERVNNVFVHSGDILLTWRFVVTHIRPVVLVFGIVDWHSLR